MFDLVIHSADKVIERDATPYVAFFIRPACHMAVWCCAGFKGGAVHRLSDGADKVDGPVFHRLFKPDLLDPFHRPVTIYHLQRRLTNDD